MYWSGAGGMAAGGVLAWQVAPAWSGGATFNWLTGPVIIVAAYSVLYLATPRRQRAELSQ